MRGGLRIRRTRGLSLRLPCSEFVEISSRSTHVVWYLCCYRFAGYRISTSEQMALLNMLSICACLKRGTCTCTCLQLCLRYRRRVHRIEATRQLSVDIYARTNLSYRHMVLRRPLPILAELGVDSLPSSPTPFPAMASTRSRTPTSRPQRPHRTATSRSEPGQTPASHSAGPWQHIAETHAWVVEQDFERQDKGSRKTERWVLEQQIFYTDPKPPKLREKGVREKVWEEMVYAYENEADRWMREEEEIRRMATERQRERTRLVEEEIRRIEMRIRHKREEAKRRIMEEKLRAIEEKERDRRERVKADKVIVDAWRKYQDQWAAISTSTQPLTFSTIPWPLATQPTGTDGIAPAGIVMFLFSTLHSQGYSRKDRIRSAQLRWHPDRFRRLMARVVEKDRPAVEEGVGIVARCLNDLMARETATNRQVSLKLNDSVFSAGGIDMQFQNL